MNSFTSSSDFMPSEQRRIYGRILLAILLGMALCLVILRVFTELNDARAESIISRVIEARAALPEIIGEPGRLAMFFGSSMVEAGFSPRMFDRWMAEQGIAIKSYNFGFGGLNPYFQDFVSRRIADEFLTADRKLDLAMIEFNPFQTTTTRWKGALPLVDTYLAMLATDAELMEIAKSDLTRGIRLFEIRYLRNDISAETITWFFGQKLQARPEESTLPEDEAAQQRRTEILEALEGRFEADYPDYDQSDWYGPWQGGGTIPSERSEETVALIKELAVTGQTDRRMDNDRLFRIRSADIIELNFEEQLIESFIRIVKNFQAISKRTEIILLPRNRDWIENSPEGRQRLLDVIQRIESETGISVRNYQDAPEITPDMFADTTHLGRYTGDIPFTRLLVDDLAKDLADP